MSYNEPALALIELRSVARGVATADVMVKKAPVRLLEARTVCPGKYMILVAGETAAVDEAYRAGLEKGAELIVDQLFLPYAHAQLIPAIQACVPAPEMKSLGVVEVFTVASALLSADAAVKAAEVTAIEIRLANGLGGKSFYTITGDLNELEAAVDAGVSIIQTTGTLVCREIIPNPHGDINLKLL
ncbi:MAG: BMC domain-containing protein [Nitrospinae bacterium]|nr:BMC domain-containing protein [Nitrospinota bacterium]